MHTQKHLTHKLLSLWLLIGISLAFGYETQAQISVVAPVELVESYTSVAKPCTASYTKVVKAIHTKEHTSPYILFSFTRFLEVQQHTVYNQIVIQKETFLDTKPSLVVRLLQRTLLSDDINRSERLS